MKISVITVSYNSSATIADTLRSVASQSHADVEHILIDGGSTDGTMAVVFSVGGRLHRVVSEPDKGIYDAMNKGLAMASGDIIGLLNADDVYADAEVLHRVAEQFASRPLDLLFGDLVYVRQDDTDVVVRRWIAGNYSRQQLRLGWMPPHPTVFIHRELLQSVGKFDLSFRIAADYEFLLRCFSGGGLRWTYLPLTLVRMRNGGESNRSLGNVLRKSAEDLKALRKNGVGGPLTLLFKNLRKIPQFFRTSPS